jgi:hypothetical protein
VPDDEPDKECPVASPTSGYTATKVQYNIDLAGEGVPYGASMTFFVENASAGREAIFTAAEAAARAAADSLQAEYPSADITLWRLYSGAIDGGEALTYP